MDQSRLEKEYNAIQSEEGIIILTRCQQYIEAMSESKLSADEIRGMVRLLKHIKGAKDDFIRERDNK